MIAVATSALLAIVLNKKRADDCIAALESKDDLLISAGAVAEAFIVSARRHAGQEVSDLINGLGFKVVSVTATSARRIARAYEQWRKGAYAAALNLGDSFA
jgi:ribonuclease VapC